MARLVLAVPAYCHFTVEHGRGHHRWVSTPEDHASARMGESIYRFALRELPGSGYFGTFPLAYLPFLWFKVMTPGCWRCPM